MLRNRAILSLHTYWELCFDKEEKAKKVTAEQIDGYIKNSSQRGDCKDISACLVIAIVSEENFCEDPNIAYTDENVAWILALQNLSKIILHSKAGEATNFIRRFITRVNVGALTNLKGVCGNYFDLILDDVLRLGTFSQCRKLT